MLAFSAESPFNPLEGVRTKKPNKKIAYLNQPVFQISVEPKHNDIIFTAAILVFASIIVYDYWDLFRSLYI